MLSMEQKLLLYREYYEAHQVMLAAIESFSMNHDAERRFERAIDAIDKLRRQEAAAVIPDTIIAEEPVEKDRVWVVRATKDRRQAATQGASSFDRRKAQRRAALSDSLDFTAVPLSEYAKIRTALPSHRKGE